MLMLTKAALDEALADFPLVARFVHLVFAICYDQQNEFI